MAASAAERTERMVVGEGSQLQIVRARVREGFIGHFS